MGFNSCSGVNTPIPKIKFTYMESEALASNKINLLFNKIEPTVYKLCFLIITMNSWNKL